MGNSSFRKTSIVVLILFFGLFSYWFAWFFMDADGDSIVDIIECPLWFSCDDTDNDGIPDYKDTDSDNDWILDYFEKITKNRLLVEDSDGDGIPDYKDVDDDNDWLNTYFEVSQHWKRMSFDEDNNGIPNYLDYEGLVCDGWSDVWLCSVMENVVLYTSIDSDWDSLEDWREDINLDGDLTNDDTDQDWIPNYQDPDDDNDTILTVFENYDQDWTAMSDDTDQDWIPNYLDYDDDNDGILTQYEIQSWKNLDTDKDWDYNHIDPDDDGDWVLTINENTDNDELYWDDDNDWDWVPNYLDNDDSTNVNDEIIISDDELTRWNISDNSPDTDFIAEVNDQQNDQLDWVELDSDKEVEQENFQEKETIVAQPIPQEWPHRCPHPFGKYPLSHGDTIIAFEKDEVVYPDECQQQERLCQYWSIQWTFTYESCVQYWSACVWPDWSSFAHNQRGTYYQYESVTGVHEDWEDICPRQTRVCKGWVWYTLWWEISPYTFVHSSCSASVGN